MKISNEIYKHYELLLGLNSPWEIDNVDLKTEEHEVKINILWAKGEKVKCPECGELCGINDHRKERTWRHLDTMQFATYITCKVPRADCKKHGVKTIKTPWSEPEKRFTLLFEKFAIDVLLASKSKTAAMKLLNVSWDELHLIQKSAVKRGLKKRKLEEINYIGIDEKSFRKGHKYASILTDIDNSRVLDITEGRTKESTEELLEKIPEKQRKDIKAISMDMWEAYRLSAKKLLPNSDIVHDKFHIVGYITKAVDTVRKQENRLLKKSGNDFLVGTKYLWLTNQNNWTEKQNTKYDLIKSDCKKTGRAWAIKELFRFFWENINKESAELFFKKWYFWATHSRLKPIIKVAKMLKRHIDNILTYFKHRITNSVAEGINSKIQNIKANAKGFRNFENYRISILFYYGKLDLYP